MDDVKNDYDLLMDRLKGSGYKLTNQRRIILDCLLKNKEDHLSCDDIYGIISKEHPEIGIATVYRTVQLFESLKMVYKLSLDDGIARYEPNLESGKHRHHHLICTKCNKVVEFKQDLLDALEAQIEKEQNFTIMDHNLQFFGYCSECSQKKGKN